MSVFEREVDERQPLRRGKVFVGKTYAGDLECVYGFMLRRFLGLFWPLFDRFFGGSIRNVDTTPEKTVKNRLKRTLKSTEDKSVDTLLEELEKKRRYRFIYRDGYKGESVSLTMPLSQKVYEYDRFPPFFEGLLPEGEMLEALLKKRKLDADDYLGQLLIVGGETIGSVTVVPP